MGRTKNFKKIDHNKWKSVTIESTEGFTDKDFEGLVGIEELDDYSVETDTTKVTPDIVKTKKNKKHSKKIKKPKNGIDFRPSEGGSDCDLVDDESEEEKDDRKKSLSMHLWEPLGIAEPILDALKHMSFTNPTPIQSKSIRVAIEDKCDILGAAETGSGKTLAFGIPLITHIMNDKSEDSSSKLRALVLAPTRELAIQVKKHLEEIAKRCSVTLGVLVGGMSVQKQERVLNKLRPDIIVATPGRLWEFISSHDNPHLTTKSVTNIKYLVVDEADRMAEKGHFEDLIRLMDILKQSPVRRQVFVFSATLTLTHVLPKRLLGSKRNRNKSMNEQQKLTNFVDMFGMSADNTQVIDLTRKGVGTPVDKLTECKVNCLGPQKDLYLYYFLTVFKGRTLIFCNSKDCLRRLVNFLKMLHLNPLSLHASMLQKKRLISLEKFESNDDSILVATDVAARGLDIANIDHVIHYQIPRTAEIYVHRSGRTARAFNKGLSLMLCEPKEEANYYKQLCKSLNKGKELQELPIDDSILKSLKQRVDLAQECDRLDHKIRKERSNKDWFRTNARKCDIMTDESSDSDHNDQSCSEQKRLKAMKKRLDALLRAPLSRTKSFYAHLLRNESTNWTQVKGIILIHNISNLNILLFLGPKKALDLIEANKRKTKRKTKIKKESKE